MPSGILYLIPTLLDEEAVESIPDYLLTAVKNCEVLFVENERSARRYLKKLQKDIVIDQYEWHTISEEPSVAAIFRQKLKEGKNAGIISEAGCPGVADPGQELIAIAQDMGIRIKPLVGPNSILLALMASGMNGQKFQFNGYLPIDNQKRLAAIKELESESAKKNCTQIFIETPYRNNQMIESLLKTCKPSTKVCIAADITGKNEWIKTRLISGWQKESINIHKRPAIFLLLAHRS